MKVDLVIRYLGFGERCSSCGRVRETTRYTLRQGEVELQQFLLCDKCQDAGYVINFEPKRPSTTTVKDRRRRIKISRQLEQGVAEDIGGRTTPGSGNQDVKADIRKMGEWRLEHKFTDSMKGYRVLIDDLAAVVRHANLAGEWPGLIINFRRLKRQFAIVPYELFLAIVEKMHG